MPSSGPSTTTNPTPYQLRSLVLDYLTHSCYTSTARAFNKESTIRHLDADGDEIIIEHVRPGVRELPVGGQRIRKDPEERFEALMKQVELRRQIRTEILCGRVDSAISLLNQHFPAVLSEADAIQRLPSDDPRPPTNNIEYVSSTSTEPAHLLLNLRILAFSEACRTVPLEYPPKPIDPMAMDTDTDDTPIMVAPDPMALLAKAQKLHAFINALPNPMDRATYSKELENVAGLLAYKVPEQSSTAKYLTLERREAVADQINRAILERTNRPLVSTVELLTRYTHLLWEAANQQRVKARPSTQVLPPRTIKTLPSAENEAEVVPMFDLHTFLETKP